MLRALAILGVPLLLLAAAAPAAAHVQIATPTNLTVCNVIFEPDLGGLFHYHTCNGIPYCIKVGPVALLGSC